MTDTSQEEVVAPEANEGDVEPVVEGDNPETISIPKADYDKLNQTLGSLKREVKDLKKPKDETKETPIPKQTSGLDEAQLDFFELKGYSDPDQIAVFQKIMKNTGMSHREVLKDEYAVAKVKAIQEEKAVKGATPSGTKRGSNNATNDENYWYAKYDQDGKLPENMPSGMAEKLVDRKASESDVRKEPF